MAKKQKNFYATSDICALVSEFQESTGATFAKVVAASLLCYLLDGDGACGSSHRTERHARWMKYAVRLDRGDVTIKGIEAEIAGTAD